MQNSVFVELHFWLLVLFSVVLPLAIYAGLWTRRKIGPVAVLVFGVMLVLIAGIDVYLLQHLTAVARHSASLADDKVFLSELSVALYALPVMFGGIGVNLISHVLLRHLNAAEKRFEREQ